jgi:hypothetical protein
MPWFLLGFLNPGNQEFHALEPLARLDQMNTLVPGVLGALVATMDKPATPPPHVDRFLPRESYFILAQQQDPIKLICCS